MMAAGANWHPAPRGERRSWPIFVPLLIPLAVLAGFAVFVVLTPFTPTTKEPPPGRVGALIWGDGIFANNRELSAWLRLHGGSYSAWVKRHPAGLTLITPRKKHSARTRKAAPIRKAKAHQPAAAAATATATATASVPGDKGASHWLVFVLITVGSLLALAAALPASLLGAAAARAGRTSPPALVAEYRMVAAAMGLAILAGVVLAAVLS